jgi:hypothetical protein
MRKCYPKPYGYKMSRERTIDHVVFYNRNHKPNRLLKALRYYYWNRTNIHSVDPNSAIGYILSRYGLVEKKSGGGWNITDFGCYFLIEKIPELWNTDRYGIDLLQINSVFSIDEVIEFYGQ